ncbi:MAG: recombination mediator RecR [Bacteroidia bacterium]|nr:recombination mediator RecR [Bacteroidia bacterium]
MENIIDDCIEMFASLPGVGKKTASRYVIHLLKNNKKELIRMYEVLGNAISKIRECPVCHAIIGLDDCPYCNQHRCSKGTLCLVQDFRDLIAMENTGKYFGTYHILGGLISPVDGIGPNDLNLVTLEKRLNAGVFHELIFALGTTRESETTQFFLHRKFQDLVQKFSTLPKGIAHGIGLEFTDELTLGSAIENRVPL